MIVVRRSRNHGKLTGSRTAVLSYCCCCCRAAMMMMMMMMMMMVTRSEEPRTTQTRTPPEARRRGRTQAGDDYDVGSGPGRDARGPAATHCDIMP
eukprot:761659-Hanusia_phi.AAC.2